MQKKQRGKLESWKTIGKLQAVVLIYTMAGILAKLASGEDFLSLRFLLFTGLELLILFVYALLWQQVIKKTELTIAYANREMYLLWSLLWAVIFFHNQITPQNVIGCLLVIAGTLVITWEEHTGEKAAEESGESTDGI